jgi:hypothetical protein
MIVLLGIGAAILYGILHDQVTARICVEYFTVGHPPLFPTDSPTLLAFGWGILATWWVGLALGLAVAVAARAGSRPKLAVRDLLRPTAVLLGCMAAASLLLGLVGFLLAKSGSVWLLEPLASAVPADRHVRFLADAWAHMAAYGTGFLGGGVLSLGIWRRRRKLAA